MRLNTWLWDSHSTLREKDGTMSQHTPPSAVNLARHGQPGSPIPGSRYFRAYCYWCGEPMRTPNASIPSTNVCEVCSGRKRNWTPGGVAGPLDADSGGYGANARMALEGD